MDKTPPEILSKFIDSLDKPLAPYSTISRDWQCSIEARTLAKIRVRSDDASKLNLIFEDARRRASLRSLSYEIILPSYSAMRWSKLPSRRECLENNTVFTRELRRLFALLHSYNKFDGATAFRLELGVSCSMNSHEPPPTQSTNEGVGADRNNNTYIYFDPVMQEPLPVLTKVAEIGTIRDCRQRNLHPAVLGLILQALPAIEKMDWNFSGPEVRLHDLRRDIRTSLAHALLSPGLSSLRECHLEWSDAECSNHSINAGSLLNPNTAIDELSLALRRIAQLPTIKILRLTGSFILSPEFFQENPDTSSLPTSWPSLEILELSLSSMTPDGDWYYTGDPSSTELNDHRSYISDEEEEDVNSSDSEFEDYPAVWDWVKLNGERPHHPWRNEPGPAFNLFLLKIARSIPQMPALRRLTCQVGLGTNLVTDVEFLSEGEKPWTNKYFTLESRNKTYDRPHWEIVLTRRDEPTNQKTTWKIPEELKQAWRYTTGSDVDSVLVVNGGQELKL